jgi:hypothetical protein
MFHILTMVVMVNLTLCVCQNSLNCTLKICKIYCKLYLRRADIFKNLRLLFLEEIGQGKQMEKQE